MSWVITSIQHGQMRINTESIARYYDTEPRIFGSNPERVPAVIVEMNSGEATVLPMTAKQFSNAVYKARKFGFYNTGEPAS